MSDSSKKDSVFRTFLVAFLTCAICSVFVAGASVMLRPIQQKNQELFKNKNILIAAGLLERGEKISADEVAKRLESIQILKVDLATGAIVASGEEAKAYDERAAAKSATESVKIAGTKAGAKHKVGLATRGKYGTVYVTTVPDSGKQRVVLPIVGKGLWSVLYGFITLDLDDETNSFNRVSRLLFYDQGETAGLGGEIENPNWQAKWEGQKAYLNGEPAISVVKGGANPESPYEVDGISGATLTGNGVNGTVHYWLEEMKPFLEKLAAGDVTIPASAENADNAAGEATDNAANAADGAANADAAAGDAAGAAAAGDAADDATL